MRTVFQFAFRCSDGSTKFLLVEAVNAEQAACVREAVGAGLDERCILLAAFAGCEEASVHNSAFSHVEFVDFMADLAGFDGLPEALQARIERAAGGEPEAPVKATPDQVERLTGALTKLGFGAGSVKKWVKSIGPRAETAPLDALVKDGIRALVSAPAN
jgi:hypothetical protein